MYSTRPLLGSSGRARLRAIFSDLCLALGLEGLPGDLLHHVGALLLCHGDALPASGVGTLLLVNIPGHRSQIVLADLLGLVAAHLARSVHIFANLSGDWITLLVSNNRALLFCDLLGSDARNSAAHAKGSWAAVLDRNLLAMLSVGHLTINLGHLATLEFRNISTFLSGEGATLS